MGEAGGCILVVDDELAVRLTVREILRRAGHDPIAVASGEEALELVQSQAVDLALVDMVMPGMGGIELMRRLQDIAPDLVMIVLTARGSMETAVEALRLGAHDYLTKPCDDQLLLRCVESGLVKRRDEQRRRHLVGALTAAAQELAGDAQATGHPEAGAEEESICLGGLTVDVVGYAATLDGQPLDLTPTEFDLLVFFARNPGRALSHRELVQAVRGYEAQDWEAREIVRYHVHGLRSKLGDADYVETVRGVGYRLRIPGE